MVSFRYLPIYVIFAVCFTVSGALRGALSNSFETKILNQILNDYDNRVLPNPTMDGKPVVVKINMFVRSIQKINTRNMEFSVELTFRQKWLDSRLRYNDTNNMNVKYITLNDAGSIWKPDTFFSNEIQAKMHNLLQPNILIRIYENGEVLYSTRLSLVFACPMDLKYYPFDEQTCPVRIASYSHTSEELVLEWDYNVQPIQITKNLNLPFFTLQNYQTSSKTSRTVTGEYVYLIADFLVKRDIHYYLLQCYIPCTMLVLISWLNFWLDHVHDLLARVFISLISLVTLSSCIIYLNVKLPHVSYNKAIDVWTGVCLMFIFASLIELVAVGYLYGHRSKKNSYKEDDESTDEQTDDKDLNAIKEINKRSDESSRRTSLWKRLQDRLEKSRSNKVDVISRGLFPLAFLLFIFVYMLVYSFR